MNHLTHLSLVLSIVVSIQSGAFGQRQISLEQLSHLKMSLRAYPRDVLVGDPVYLEVQIVNEGREPVVAPSFGSSNLEFRARSKELSLETDCLLGSAARTYGDVGRSDVTYFPNQPIKGVFRVFVPPLNRIREPFWDDFAAHGSIELRSTFWINLPVQLTYGLANIRLDRRPESETHALKRWSQPPSDSKFKADTKVLFGSARLLSVRSRQDTKEFAGAVKSGEFGEFVRYVLRLQDLEVSSNREADSQSLVEWLRIQPDIKREWLAQDILSRQGLVSDSVVREIKELMTIGPTGK
jgi:hypothetical protein